MNVSVLSITYCRTGFLCCSSSLTDPNILALGYAFLIISKFLFRRKKTSNIQSGAFQIHYNFKDKKKGLEKSSPF